VPKVLVAPGSGDIHWAMLKMESIIEQEFGGVKPEVHVWCEAHSTKRSQGYVERIPFVKWGGYFEAKPHHAFGSQVFVRGNPWFVKDWEGFDLFIALNAPLGAGEPLEIIGPQWKINWDYELKLRGADLRYGKKLHRKHGEYVPVWFCGHSFYKGWLDKFTIAQMHDLVEKIEQSGRKVVLTGAKWDVPFMRQFANANRVDLVGKTTMGELLGTLKYADAYVGHAAGQGMLAQHMGTNTFLLWHPHQWTPGFMNNWVQPGKIKTTYHGLDLRNPCTPYILENL
jgi:hypothetical protein